MPLAERNLKENLNAWCWHHTVYKFERLYVYVTLWGPDGSIQTVPRYVILMISVAFSEKR